MIYLAIPYTFNPELSFKIANRAAADLMTEGEVVYSPISMGHVVADYLDDDLRLDHEFWMKQCLPMLEKCDELRIVKIDATDRYWMALVEESKGCVAEIEKAKELGIPITYTKPYYE